MPWVYLGLQPSFLRPLLFGELEASSKLSYSMLHPGNISSACCRDTAPISKTYLLTSPSHPGRSSQAVRKNGLRKVWSPAANIAIGVA